MLHLPDASLFLAFNPCCVLVAALWIWKDTKTKQPPALTWQNEWQDLITNPAHSGSSLTHPPTHSPTHSLTHPLTHPPNHSPTHRLTHPPTHPPTHAFTHPPTHPLKHPCTYSLTHPSIYAPTHLLTHLLACSSTRSCACAHPLIQLLTHFIESMLLRAHHLHGDCRHLLLINAICIIHSLHTLFFGLRLLQRVFCRCCWLARLHAVSVLWQQHVQIPMACRAGNSARS